MLQCKATPHTWPFIYMAGFLSFSKLPSCDVAKGQLARGSTNMVVQSWTFSLQNLFIYYYSRCYFTNHGIDAQILLAGKYIPPGYQFWNQGNIYQVRLGEPHCEMNLGKNSIFSPYLQLVLSLINWHNDILRPSCDCPLPLLIHF